MASQQAWNDFESLLGLVAGFHSEISGTFQGYLDNVNTLFNAIVADPARVVEVTVLADTHPTVNAAYLTTEIGKILTLRTWLIANGYIIE